MRLDVYVASHCLTCSATWELVERTRQRFPRLTITVHDIEQDPAVCHPEIIAVPTYMLDGRVLCIGNPEEGVLWAALATQEGLPARPARFVESAWRHFPEPLAHGLALVGAASSFLSCGGPLAALGAEALRLAGSGLSRADVLAFERVLAPVADPLLLFGLLCMVTGLLRRGRWPVTFAISGAALLHFSMVVSHPSAAPTFVVSWLMVVLLLAGLMGIILALVLSSAPTRRAVQSCWPR
jgi:hypothetical protein